MKCPDCGAAFPENCIVTVDGYFSFTFKEDGTGSGLHCHSNDDGRYIECMECGWETTSSDDPNIQALIDNPDRGQELQWG